MDDMAIMRWGAMETYAPDCGGNEAGQYCVAQENRDGGPPGKIGPTSGKGTQLLAFLPFMFLEVRQAHAESRPAGTQIVLCVALRHHT